MAQRVQRRPDHLKLPPDEPPGFVLPPGERSGKVRGLPASTFFGGTVVVPEPGFTPPGDPGFTPPGFGFPPVAPGSSSRAGLGGLPVFITILSQLVRPQTIV